MEKLILIALLLLISFYLHAQDYSFPIGKTQAEIRNGNKKIPLEFSTRGDTIDYYTASNQQMVFYYKNSICFRMTEIFYLDYEFVIQDAFDKDYRKVKANTWIDQKNNEIDLTENKDLNRFSFEVYSLDKN